MKQSAQDSIPDPEPEQQITEARGTKALPEERRATEGSFHSAKEEQTMKVLSADQGEEQDVEMTQPKPIEDDAPALVQSMSDSPEEKADEPMADQQSTNFEHEFEDIGSPSDGSTPDRPLVRKSSLTFASLPAREPLKKSIGGRTSRISQLDPAKAGATSRNSYLVRHAGGPQALQRESEEETVKKDQEVEDIEDDGTVIADDDDPELKAARQHNKSSTQRLHEKIDMLGKSQQTRLSKSIPSAATLAAFHLRQSEAASRVENATHKTPAVPGSVADDDDDWIKPLKSPESGNRPPLFKSHTTDIMEGIADDDTEDEEDYDMRAPELIAHEARMRTPVRMSPGPGQVMSGFGHVKSASTATLVSPAKAAMGPPPSPAKTISFSNPQFPTTTPQGSPRRIMDGTLSASKSKLHSIMKTAKGLFSSSAGISAAAKMETLSPNALRIAANNMPGLYPNLNSMLENKPLPPSPPKQSRRTRSSTEKEKEEKKKEKAMHKMDNQLEKAREQEKQRAAQFKQAQEKAASKAILTTEPTRSSPRRPIDDQQVQEASDMAPPMLPSHSSKLSRPTKPMREVSQKSKPQPVAIRVGTHRMPMTTSSLASSLQETLQSAEPRRPGLTKKASTNSVQSASSNSGFKTSVSAQPAKPRALVAAERKKEQDEREAQRKLEHKQELERKRAAQQEEARKQEQRQRQDIERKERERVAAEQAKRAAQQQAIEKKRTENARKLEQQRNERVANDAVSIEMAESIFKTNSMQPPTAAVRVPSRMGAAQPINRSLINHPLPTNPAKPAKRPLEEDAGPSRPQAPKFGAAAQQTDAKRRRTEDESIIEVAPAPRPTMSGAPIRQSHLGKKPSIFNHGGYAPAPAPPHISQTQSQMQQFPHPPNPHRVAHPTAMAQFANGGKIPFADAPNPPAHNGKTPASAHQSRALQLVKSSPHYQNGEAIHLPEIPTDSEDEDSGDEGNAFPVPDWATPGHLTDQLMRQEGVDGDAVFGPIAPLKMEEIFAKGNKERLKRMRERTSSANWAFSGDGLTVEEVRADREQREKMRIEGGWRYGS